MAENTAPKKSTSTTKKSAAKKSAPKKSAAPAEAVDLSIPVEPTKGVRVDLGGTVYTVRPIKTTLGMSLATRLQGLKEDPKEVSKAMDQLVNLIFQKEDREGIHARFNDPDDSLDYNHVMSLLTKLMERATGNPTTSPSA